MGGRVRPVPSVGAGGALPAALRRLREAGLAYPCFCSRAEIAAAARAPHGPADDGPRYPGTCRGLAPAEVARRGAARAPAWRLRVEPGQVAFDDAVHGACRFDVAAATGDFVVMRADGIAAYQLAVVVDDAAMGITDVVRGDDLLPSTARQLLLYGALGLPAPRFAHVPLVVGEDGERLAKRHGARSLGELRAAGVAPEAVVGLLAAQSAGWRRPGRRCTAAELVRRLRLGAAAAGAGAAPGRGGGGAGALEFRPCSRPTCCSPPRCSLAAVPPAPVAGRLRGGVAGLARAGGWPACRGRRAGWRSPASTG